MQAFLRFPIILKLLLMAVPPLLLALYFMATSITDNHSRAVKMEAYLKLSQVSLHANALVHELQKEHGASAIFLSSEGESFANELAQQRANSEKSLQALRQSLANYKAYTPVLESILKDVDSSLAGIDKLRQEIDALQINVSTAVERYTQKNRDLLAITSFIAKDADDGQVSKSASAYVYLLKSKELAGLERALISRTFSQDYATNDLKNKYISLAVLQSNFFELAQQYASNSDSIRIKQALRSTISIQVEQVRQIAWSKNREFSIAAEDWFSNSSKRINLLREIELSLESSFNRLTETKAKNAWNTFLEFNRPINNLIFGFSFS